MGQFCGVLSLFDQVQSWQDQHRSRRYALIALQDAKLLGTDLIKELYDTDSDFSEIYKSCAKSGQGKFFIHDGFLYCNDKLCIPSCSVRELLTREAHGGGLMRHFGVTKTLSALQEHLYWSRMRRDVERGVSRCITCSPCQVQAPNLQFEYISTYSFRTLD